MKKAAFDPGAARLVCRQNKIADYRKSLDENGIDWLDEKETADGFSVTLRERRPVFEYRIDLIASRPGAGAEMAKALAGNKADFVKVILGKEERVGIKFLSKISIITFIATREELESVLPVPPGAKIVK